MRQILSKRQQKKIRVKNRILELELKILTLMDNFAFEKYDKTCRELLEEEINKFIKQSNVWFARGSRAILRLEPNWNEPKIILYSYFFTANLLQLINDEK